MSEPNVLTAKINTSGGARLMVALAPPLVLVALGLLFIALAYTQPAFIGQRIGPGLFAQWLSKGVVTLAALWAVAILFDRRAASVDEALTAGNRPADQAPARRPLLPGMLLLLAVLVFIVLKPVVGLVGACAATAGVAGWAAGDRGLIALLGSAFAAGITAWLLGVTLLPPGMRLWPDIPF